MGVRTINRVAIVGAVAAPGQVIETFTAAPWPDNVQPILVYAYYCGQIGDVGSLWLRPVLGSGVDEEITLATFTAGSEPANESRFCYPVPVTSGAIAWVFGFTRTTAGAANASIEWAYESSEAGAR